MKHSFPFTIPKQADELLNNSPSAKLFEKYEDLADAATGGKENLSFEVAYEVPGKGSVVEAVVHRVSNGISANYTEPYMRRRDPDTMLIADDMPSDKLRYETKIGKPFGLLRQESFEWLQQQELAYFFFKIGLNRFPIQINQQIRLRIIFSIGKIDQTFENMLVIVGN